MADVKADSALVMCSTQDVYGTRNSLSRLLGMPAEKIRVQYYEGSGTYGHSCYDDVAQAAVPVLPGDTPKTLAARVLIEEHKLYPEALKLVASGKVNLEGGRVLSAV